MSRRCAAASEATLMAMACLSPWAFGAVEPWAEFALELGVVLLAVLAAIARPCTDRRRALTCVPSLALAGLVLLALIQLLPLPLAVLRAISPASAALHKACCRGRPNGSSVIRTRRSRCRRRR